MFKDMIVIWAMLCGHVFAQESNLSSEVIESDVQYTSMSVESSELVPGGRVVKFVIDARNPQDLKIYYINGNYKRQGVIPESAQYHMSYSVERLGFPDARDNRKRKQNERDDELFNRLTYFTPGEKHFFAGKIQTYVLGEESKPTYYGVQFYPQDVIKEDEIVVALEVVKRSFHASELKMAFVSLGAQQTTAQVGEEIKRLGFENFTVDRILGSKKYLPLHKGKTMGVLRMNPALQDLSQYDIPVFIALPLDLSVVAGVITKDFQDSLSHINLKSKERNTPNMVLRDAGPNHPRLKAFINKPVSLEVTADGFVIKDRISPRRPSFTLADVKKFWDARQNREWQSNPYVASEDRLLFYDEMCPSDPSQCLMMRGKYGNKAGNLGFLRHNFVLGTGQGDTPDGFGIPLRFYDDLVSYEDRVTGKSNKVLKDALTRFVKEERSGGLTGRQRSERIAEIQKLFYTAIFPPQRLAQITSRVQQLKARVTGFKKIKVRSSANAEDVEKFDGAGLYDSYSADPAETDTAPCALVPDNEGSVVKMKMKPDTIECAIKGVYASLWNRRAVEERSFARVDHASSKMGISVVPKYNTESKIIANSVVVTRVINVTDMYGYTLSVQKDNNLVTNPDPGTISEVTIAGFISDTEPLSLSPIRFATPEANKPPLTASILKPEQMKEMVEISKKVERAYCRYKKKTPKPYYTGSCEGGVTWDRTKPKSLDMEFKVLENGSILCKQVREFSGK